MTTIEFFYDVSSPWTYYAYARIEDFCAKNKAELIWKPFLVGAVFNKVNPSVYQRRESPIEAKDRTEERRGGKDGDRGCRRSVKTKTVEH